MIFSLFVLGSVAFTKEKEYPIKLKQGQVYNILDVINQSNAPHLQVVQAQKDLGEALKPFIDSTGRLK